MKKIDFCEVVGDINEDYVKASRAPKAKKKPIWVKWGAMAACLCLVLVGGVTIYNGDNTTVPVPELVQVVNPMMEVSSVEEMEKYLDFDIPTLDKEVECYFVFVEDQYPTMGQINYADGSTYRIKYGSEDISGVHGATLVDHKNIDGINVNEYRWDKTTYAIWEQNGFSFSYTYPNDGNSDLETLIHCFK